MLNQNTHKRWHPFLQKWIIIANQTQKRPWSGANATHQATSTLVHDPNCYLCPGNTRASNIVNPHYQKPFSFVNDFSALNLTCHHAEETTPPPPWQTTAPALGLCKVVCYHPDHHLSVAQLPAAQMHLIVDLWCTEYTQLAQNPDLAYIMIFENKGEIIGASNPHPHGQIYATDFIPQKILQYEKAYQEYSLQSNFSCLLCAICQDERNNTNTSLAENHRIVLQNDDFILLVPFFAQWPYETWLIPKNHHIAITSLNSREKSSFVDIYLKTLQIYEKLFDCPFPNIMVQFNAPTHQHHHHLRELHHFHIEFTPPLRAADKQKFLAGFEMGSDNMVNPIAPEDAAKQLREAFVRIA